MGKYPSWVCHDCGSRFGRVREGHLATYHEGDPCGWCGTTAKPVTEPRDYGYPAYPVTSLLPQNDEGPK